MNKLYQKYHGMPGIGVLGQKGNAGKDGNSIYFGFINDFFDGQILNKSVISKVAIRNVHLDSTNLEPTPMSIYEDLINSNYYEKLFGDQYTDSIRTAKDFALTSLNSSAGHQYYAGSAIDASIAKALNVNNAADYAIDVNNNMISMILMLANHSDSYKGDNIKSIECYTCKVDLSDLKISVNGQTYNNIDTYNYTNEDGIYTLDPSTQGIIIDQATITYEPENALLLVNLLDNYVYGDKTTYDSSIYNALNTSAMGIANTSGTYVKDTFTFNNSEYILDVNDQYMVINDSVGTLYKYDGAAKYVLPNTYSLARTGMELSYEKSPWQNEFRLIDNFGREYTIYGIADDTLYNSSTSLSSISDLTLVLADSKLKDRKDLITSLSEYRETITKIKESTIYNVNDPIYVQWISQGDNNVKISTNLLPNYKEGDVIYFYTDLQKWREDYAVNYMVVMTKLLEGCTVNELIKNAQIADPLAIKYFYESNGRLATNFSSNIIERSSATLTNNDKFSLASINNIIGKSSNSPLIVMSNNSTENYYIDLESDNKQLTIKQDSSAIHINIDPSTDVKFDSMYLPLYAENANVETYNAAYDNNIILNKNGMLNSLSGIEQWIINNNYYFGKELYAKDYFVNPGSDYIYGYEVYDEAGQMIISDITSDESIRMVIPFNSVGLYTLSSEITYSVAAKITLYDKTEGAAASYGGIASKYGTEYNYDSIVILNQYAYFRYVSNDAKIYVSLADITGKMTPTIYITANENSQGVYEYREATLTQEAKEGYTAVYTGNAHKLDTIFGNYSASYSSNMNTITTRILIINNLILLFAANINSGIKYYSKTSKLTYIVEEGEIKQVNISLVSDDNIDIIENTANHISFVNTGITCGEGQGKLNITSSDASICKVYFNHEEYSDSLSSLPEWISISEDSDNSFIFNVSTNIPTINDEGYSEETCATIQQYMQSLADPDTGATEDCSLFKMLNDGKCPTGTTERSVLITVSYMLDGVEDMQYESYKLTQPGFEDTRDLPDITIHMHNSFEETEKYNTLDNNVLCNQFITYMDIDIDNFDKYWGKYADASNAAGISLEIANIASDLDWVDKYALYSSAVSRNTIKLINGNEYKSSEASNNYILLHSQLVDANTNEPIEYNNCDIKTSIVLQTTSAISSTTNVTYDSPVVIDGRQYIICDEDVMSASSWPQYIYKGINENIKITLNNLSASDLQSHARYRIKFTFEMGNPIFASLYLRFALNKVAIKFGEATFTAVIPQVTSTADSYLYKFTNTGEQYRVISDKLDVAVNPISYTVCPTEAEVGISLIQGNVMKTGSNALIKQGLKFYDTDVYNSTEYMNYSTSDLLKIQRDFLYDWKAILVKKKYLQDNIGSFTVEPIKIVDNNLYSLIDSVCPEVTRSVLNVDEIDDMTYLSVIYNASIMNPFQSDGEYVFNYNSKRYEKTRYNQVADNYPIFIKASASMEVRDSSLLDSMKTWNFEYTAANLDKADGIFNGNISLYGNSYNYLPSSYDEGQYTKQGTLSLSETVDQNNVAAYNISNYTDITKSPTSIYEPKKSDYFRSFLYNIMWDYPVCLDANKITPYKIGSMFDVLLKYAINNALSIPAAYAGEVDNFISKKDIVPYNTLFNLTPRIANNTDNGTINVFMLRRPSVNSDNNKIGNYSDCYELSKHYFELAAGQSIIELKSPYALS